SAAMSRSGYAFSQIRDRGPRVELLERVVPASCGGESRDAAVRVVKIAKDNCVGGTGLCTGRCDVAVAKGAAVTLGVELARLDPLDAKRALLHHAGAADGDIGVELFAKRRRPAVSRPIEPAHFVGAVVRAEPRPDAAGVHL